MAIDASLCACGSGLRRVRCCALAADSLQLPAAHGLLAPAMLAVHAAQQAGQLPLAIQRCRELLELSPGWIEALLTLASLLRAEQPAVAELLLRRVVALDANHLAATLELGRMLLARDALPECERHARNAVRLAPESAEAHNLMGMLLTHSNRPASGEYHFRRVLALGGGDDPVLLSNLGWSLKEQGKIEPARAMFEASLARAPDNVHTLLNAARLEEVDRRFAAAELLLDRAEAVAPNNQNLALIRAVCRARSKRSQDALKILDGLDGGDHSRQLNAVDLSEKGRILDRIGRYDEAWAAFEASKRRVLDNGGARYQDQHAAQLFQRLRNFFTARRLATLPRAGRAPGAQPIFIIGFPRSGTTLLEQSLSAHPRISAGDELPFIWDIAHSLPRLLDSQLAYPESLAELWMGDNRNALDQLRDIYLMRAAERGLRAAGDGWFTDKMPLNETHLGLIALLFPEAPIIHLIRHPLDVMVSVYSNHLSHGFNCAAELESAALHFQRTAELVAHYRAELTLRYLPLRYEDLVSDQERSLRRVLDFVGESFDPRCLAFHENTRYARTASYAQVTEPIYDSSVFRHRHYLGGLAPAIPILEPVIRRLGYPLEVPGQRAGDQAEAGAA